MKPVRTFDSSTTDPVKLYSMLVHAVAPRPIALVSSLSEDGIANLAPFSFFMAGGASPCSVAVSPTTTRSWTSKDTLRNIQATRQFVINVVTYNIRDKMNQSSAPYPPEVSEWGEAGLTQVPSVKVRPARAAESPIALECVLYQIISHGSGPMSANYVIGEVVCIHVNDDLFDENDALDVKRVDYIGRMGGDWYSRATPAAMFELARPD